MGCLGLLVGNEYGLGVSLCGVLEYGFCIDMVGMVMIVFWGLRLGNCLLGIKDVIFLLYCFVVLFYWIYLGVSRYFKMMFWVEYFEVVFEVVIGCFWG